MNQPVSDKKALRRTVLERRDAEPDREEKSRKILERLKARPEFVRARRVMTYVGVGSEVATLPLIQEMLDSGRTVFVPWCEPADLRLFHLRSIDELAPSGYGLLEPLPELRLLPERDGRPESLDLIVAPGVAFDRQGNRLGHGRGYYDRLLVRARGVPAIAVAFECQMVDRVPMSATDVRVDVVITEQGTIPALG